MCNLRNNITLRSSTATLYICLFFEGFCILDYEITDPRMNLTSGQHKNSAREENVFKLLLHAFDYEFCQG